MMLPNKIRLRAQSPGDWGSLTSVLAQPLPDEFLGQLVSSPLASALGRKSRGGKGLKVRLTDLRLTGPAKWSQTLSGESVQASFVAKVLAHILPSLVIVAGPGRNYVRFNIADEESSAGIKPSVYPVLPMNILKAANPGVRIIKDVARNQLSLPASAKIIALTVPFGENSATTQKIIRLLFQKTPVEILILSFTADGRFGPGGYESNKDLIRTIDWESEDVPVLTDSKEWIDVRSKSARFIIHNQTFGLMPYVYSASDHAILAGPGNIFEPLNVDTPVSFPNTVSFYDEQTWNQTKTIAAATGGGFEYFELGEIAEHIHFAAAPTKTGESVKRSLKIQNEAALNNLLERLATFFP